MIRNVIFSIFVLLLVVGGSITSYGYWSESSANRIVEIEIPHQEDLITGYGNELKFLETNASEVYLKYQTAKKASSDYLQVDYDYLIGTAAGMLIPLPPVISELSTLSTIFDLLGHIEESAENLQKSREKMEEAERYYEKYEALQREIEEKKQLISSTEKKIDKLKDTANSRVRNAPKAKFGGAILAGIGVFGLILSVFKKRRR